ncbi:MAG: CoA transferase [Dehalococcoidia bacterium]|nr:CoA transferase [Dehalococcoidia bacterium]
MTALAGLRILDLTQLLAGPYGSMLLADLGAEVIKIEQPGIGDLARVLQENDPKFHYKGMSAYFLTLGRNKKSVTLNLGKEKGREVFYDLVRVSDVVFDNFRPGVVERLGVDYETLKQINPRIISCSNTGYGLTGPGKDRPAYDACVQAFSGGMSITGEPEGVPMRAGVPYGDLCGGVFSTLGILSAVYARQTTGVGQKIDVSMLDAQISLWNYMATMTLMANENIPKMGNEHFVHVPYNAYKAGDIYVVLTIVPDAHYELFVRALEALNLPQEYQEDVDYLKQASLLKRAGRQAERTRINSTLTHLFPAKPAAEWVEYLSGKGIPIAPVYTGDQAFNDPHVIARRMIVEVEHPQGGTFREPGNPIKLSDTPGDTFSPPPLLGQHTEDILAGLLKYAPEKIADLKREGLI